MAQQTAADVQSLFAKIGRPSRSQRRAARLLDGEVFTTEAEARTQRAALRAEGKKVRYTKVNVDGDVVHVVKEV
jgi:hypothetical protein